MPRMRLRAEICRTFNLATSHIHKTSSQYHVPAYSSISWFNFSFLSFLSTAIIILSLSYHLTVASERKLILFTSCDKATPKMSGLEVVAAVAGIVGAYAASAGVYYSWRSKRAARKSNAQNQGLEVSLTTGKTGVQKEYDQGFSRLGREFAVGDGKCFFVIAAGFVYTD